MNTVSSITQQLAPPMRVGGGIQPYSNKKALYLEADRVTFGKGNGDRRKPPVNPWPLVLLGSFAAAALGLKFSPQQNTPQPIEPLQSCVEKSPSYKSFYENDTVSDGHQVVLTTPQEVLQKIQGCKVQEITVDRASKMWQITLTNGNQQHWLADPKALEADSALKKAMAEKGLIPQIQSNGEGMAQFAEGAKLAIYLVVIVFLIKMMKSVGGKGLGGSVANQANTANTTKPKVTLDEVAGIPEVVDEIRSDIINMFQHQQSVVGEKLPRGIMLEGPPGTGKTLLAKAIAGELNRPFYSISGSNFVELYVGMGAKRVRELFQAAKKNAPCVIFIDEIDAVGRKRGASLNSHEEREQTLNEILAQMDGFDASYDVLVIAATNRIDVLDEALVRPGRFDKHYTITAPMHPEGREAILKVHLKGKQVDPSINPLVVAKQMPPGTTGAEIAEMVNDAALVARRQIIAGRKERCITQADLTQAIERFTLGLAKNDNTFKPEDKRRVAVHEGIGHATLGWALGLTPNIITVVPRDMRGGGTALGLVGTDPEKIPHLFMTREHLEKQILMALGGRAAEEVYYKDSSKVSSGASNDWEKANQWMKAAIESWVLYPELIGHLVTLASPNGGADGSEMRKAKAEQARNDLLTGLYDVAKTFLASVPPDAMNKLIQTLEERETLNDPNEIAELFNSCGVDLEALWQEKGEPLRKKLETDLMKGSKRA